MKERPILFSAPMVRAILDSRKTQTRRLLRHDGPPENPPTEDFCEPGQAPWTETTDRGTWIGCNEEGTTIFTRCPYGVPGDRLWVRETHAFTNDGLPTYFDDFTSAEWEARRDRKPSIFMRRAHSRITLAVTGVRVERLQAISEDDAEAEGIPTTVAEHTFRKCFRDPAERAAERVKRYAKLWDEINGKRAAWASNPWVWVVEFKRAEAEAVAA